MKHTYIKYEKHEFDICCRCKEYSCDNCAASLRVGHGWECICLKCVDENIKMCMICGIKPCHADECDDYKIDYLKCQNCKKKGCFDCIQDRGWYFILCDDCCDNKK